jgi:hypothetical protein
MASRPPDKTLRDPPSLDSPRAKLGRAAEHVETFWLGMRDYMNRNPHAIVEDREPDDEGWRVSRLRELEDPPVGLSLVFGDCIHNMRTALDSLAYQLARLGGGASMETQFLICNSATDFAKKRGRRLAGVSDEYVAAIEAWQPFPDRTGAEPEALRIVRDFDNIDKHQTLHPSVTVLVDSEAPKVDTDDAHAPDFRAEVEYLASKRPLRDGDAVARARILANEKPERPVTVKLELSLDIVFGATNIALKPVHLPDIWRAVQSMIESFAPAFKQVAQTRRV